MVEGTFEQVGAQQNPEFRMAAVFWMEPGKPVSPTQRVRSLFKVFAR